MKELTAHPADYLAKKLESVPDDESEKSEDNQAISEHFSENNSDGRLEGDINPKVDFVEPDDST